MPDPVPVPVGANPDLAKLHSDLVALVATLDRAVGKATTKSQVIALLDEISDVNARVNMVGRQLFTQQTAEITKAAGTVEAAIPDIEKAIADLDKLQDFINGMTKFLKLVDQVLAVAKVVI